MERCPPRLQAEKAALRIEELPQRLAGTGFLRLRPSGLQNNECDDQKKQRETVRKQQLEEVAWAEKERTRGTKDGWGH